MSQAYWCYARFVQKTMLPLRSIALGSNLAFISYGALLHLYPVLMLHVVLLPLNTWRLAEILLLSKRTQKMVGSEAIFSALSPFATRTFARQSEVIIRKGDPSDCLYLVYEGLLWVAEAGAELGPGSVIGEMGVLSRSHARTATVRATQIAYWDASRRKILIAFISPNHRWGWR